MSTFSTGSFFARDTNSTITQNAEAASDASYRVVNNLTISIWHAGQPGTNKNIASLWEETGNQRCWILSNQADGTLRLILSANGSGISSNHKTVNAIFDFSWKHIMVTFASGAFFVYVNNVLQTLTVTTAWTAGAVPLHSTSAALMVGGKNPGAPPADDTAGGCYSNLSIWNKVLSSDERAELYNAGRPANLALHSAYASCTNWWRMDQSDTPPTLVDSKNGAASNMTILKSGANAVFDPSANYPKVEDPPSPGSVLSGVTYDIDQVGTFVAPTASEIADAVLGDSKALTVAKFIGLK
jgi:hypothetical protein